VKIWVDADACPVAIKEILFRASQRKGIPLTLVANQPMKHPDVPGIDHLLVEAGPDEADTEIVARLAAGDLVITADIPLAAAVIEKGGHALNPRGEMYSPDTIKSRLAMRDFMETLRDSGVITGGPSALSQADRRAFANQLDSFLAKR
jgi:uncharacterized protein YaiI (UPF0178 family)